MCSCAERRLETPLRDPFDDEVDHLVVERAKASHLRDRRERCGVGPGDLGGIRLSGNAPVFVGYALVWTAAPGRGRLQDGVVHILAGHVVARREVGLKEQHRSGAFGEPDLVNLDDDVPAARNGLVQGPWLPAEDQQVPQLRGVSDPGGVQDHSFTDDQVQPLRDRALR